jgi:hypothetical protein
VTAIETDVSEYAVIQRHQVSTLADAISPLAEGIEGAD